METSDSELPESLGPVLIKELRQNLRRASFVYPFLFIHVLAIVAVFFDFQLGMNGSDTSVPGLFIWIPQEVGAFWWVALGICAFVLPAGGFFSMSQEIDDGNHEILQLTQLSRWEIVKGKFITLWLLCILTFLSLLPYIIIRYFIGGIEWIGELANAGTVICIAGLICAATIAASGYKALTSKFGVGLLALSAIFLGGGGSLIIGIMWMNTATATGWIIAGIVFHQLSAIAITFCLIAFLLLIARSQLRIATFSYELKPSSTLMVMLGCVSLTALVCGVGGLIGIPLLTFLAYHSDRTPKAPKSVMPPPLNIPSQEDLTRPSASSEGKDFEEI